MGRACWEEMKGHSRQIYHPPPATASPNAILLLGAAHPTTKQEAHGEGSLFCPFAIQP